MDNTVTTQSADEKQDMEIQGAGAKRNMEMETGAPYRHSLTLPSLVTLAAAILVVVAFFLPLATANAEYTEYLKKYAEELNVPEIKMTNEDAIHISMYEFAKTYWACYDLIDKTLAMVVTAVIGAAGIFSLITLLVALFKKPVAVIIFNVFTLGAYYLTIWDFKDRGVMPNSNYDWGIAYYLYYIGIVVVFAGAVWLLAAKIKQRRRG